MGKPGDGAKKPNDGGRKPDEGFSCEGASTSTARESRKGLHAKNEDCSDKPDGGAHSNKMHHVQAGAKCEKERGD